MHLELYAILCTMKKIHCSIVRCQPSLCQHSAMLIAEIAIRVLLSMTHSHCGCFLCHHYAHGSRLSGNSFVPHCDSFSAAGVLVGCCQASPYFRIYCSLHIYQYASLSSSPQLRQDLLVLTHFPLHSHHCEQGPIVPLQQINNQSTLYKQHGDFSNATNNVTIGLWNRD